MGGYSIHLGIERFRVVKIDCYWPLLGYHIATF
jgi:hypothetical protein